MLNRSVPEDRTVLKVRERHSEKVLPSEDADPGLIRFKSPVNNLKVMVWRDSFGPALIRFMSESFGESVFIHGYELDMDLIRKEKPDIVVQEVVERRLDIYEASYD